MAQLNLLTIFFQIIFLISFFLFIYIFFYKFFIPKLHFVIFCRALVIFSFPFCFFLCNLLHNLFIWSFFCLNRYNFVLKNNLKQNFNNYFIFF